MATIGEICDWMQEIAPLHLSEDWDNTGLILGDRARHATKVMTCLTLTPQTVAEAISESADLVISHHPLPFKPLAQITTQTTPGRLVWELASHSISVYAPHTAWDSAEGGINAQLAEKLHLEEVRPVIPRETGGDPIAGSEGSSLSATGASVSGRQTGAGRIGNLAQPASLESIVEGLSTSLPEIRPRGVTRSKEIKRIAIACGSGGSLLSAALKENCDLFLTGEATFHTCLEAEAAGIALLMIGHFASERFSLVTLAEMLRKQSPQIEAWAAKSEQDPVRNLA